MANAALIEELEHKHDLQDSWVRGLMNCKYPSEKSILDLCNRAKELLAGENNVVRVDAPVTICGDIHGQLYDLLELFNVGGECPCTNYLFMGDYVDRGFYSLETVLLLLSFKVRHPRRITLIRGNHESRQITQVYGFYDECMRKFGTSKVWSACMEVFDALALGAVVAERVFAVHAGLSPSIDSIEHIEMMDRRQEVPHEGPMCDLMWSDPEDISGWGISPRGAGYIFGADVVEKFCRDNNLDVITRSHQLVMEGYKWMFGQQLVTVWSAPNYCYRCGNEASILAIDETLKQNFIVFGPAPEESRVRPTGGGKRAMPDYFL